MEAIKCENPRPELNSSWWHAGDRFVVVEGSSGLRVVFLAWRGPRLACDYTLRGPEVADSAS